LELIELFWFSRKDNKSKKRALIVKKRGVSGVINAFAGALSGGHPLPQQVTDMVSAMSSSPFSGGYTDTIYGQGSVAIDWGLGVGSYLFIVAAAIKITAGVLLRQTKVPESDENKTE